MTEQPQKQKSICLKLRCRLWAMPWFTYWINLNVRLDVMLSEKGIRIGIWKPQRITGFGLPSLLEE